MTFRQPNFYSSLFPCVLLSQTVNEFFLLPRKTRKNTEKEEKRGELEIQVVFLLIVMDSP